MATEQGAAVADGSAAATSTATPGTDQNAAAASGAAPTATSTGTPQQQQQRNDADWMPRHRFNEVSNQNRDLTTRLTQAEARAAEAERRVAALAGVTPQDQNTQKAEQVKAAFFEMFPQLKVLSDLTPEQLTAVLSGASTGAQTAQQSEARYWANHGKQQVQGISARVAEALNLERLEPEQENDLRESFAVWFKNKAQSELDASNGEESATLQRYEDGDSKLLDEFVARYVKTWVEPARRVSTARVVNRTRPTPNSGGRAQVTTVQRPDKFKDLDDRLDFAVKLAKERGVQFDR